MKNVKLFCPKPILNDNLGVEPRGPGYKRGDIHATTFNCFRRFWLKVNR